MTSLLPQSPKFPSEKSSKFSDDSRLLQSIKLSQLWDWAQPLVSIRGGHIVPHNSPLGFLLPLKAEGINFVQKHG